MTDGPAQTIKEKLDVVEFLRGYLPMTPAGKNLKARCPFHNEKTPSFMISPERQSWHCFGCGLGGDIFAFLMKYENMEFGEALKVLAEKAGVELKRADPREYKVFGLLYELQDAAKDFWKEQLKTAKIAKDYLNERGLTPETIEEFEIGFAPNDQDSLAMYLINKGYDPADITRAGLIGRTERGLQYDRFRGRIMFPIHNHLGKVVGFTGRILPALSEVEGPQGFTPAKYVNSPETPIFNKSKLLYGFWKSKSAVRESGKAYLVEGQMDFLMSYQAGIKNAVATSGTALTPDHILALRKVAEELLVSFDNDDAGFAAGERAIDLAEAGGMQVRIVTLEGVKDPAEAAQKDPKILGEAIAKAEPAFKVFFKRYLPWGKVDPLNHAELKNLRILLNKIKSISSPVERDYWLKDLATYVKMSESTLKEEMEKVQTVQAPERFREEEKIIPERKYSRGERISKDLLGAAYSRGDYSLLSDVEDLLDPSSKKLLKTLKSGAKKAVDAEEDTFLNLVILEAADVSDQEIADMKNALKDGGSKSKRAELTERIKEAEAKGDEEALERAIEELKSLPQG